MFFGVVTFRNLVTIHQMAIKISGSAFMVIKIFIFFPEVPLKQEK